MSGIYVQFVSQNITPRCDVGRNLDHPSRVLGYELIISPSTGNGCVINQSDGVDLEELERGFIHSFTATRAATSKIINDRSMMRFRPVGSPLNKDSVTGSYYRVTFSIRSVEMADNIRGRVGIYICRVRKEIGLGQRGQ